MRSARDRLIVALDVPSAEEARALIEALGDSVGVYKIGLELMFAGGMALATELASRGSRVFLDAKLHRHRGDGRARHGCQSRGPEPSFSPCTPSTARRSMPRCADAATASSSCSASPCLTNLGPADLIQQGTDIPPGELVLHRAMLAMEAGFDGVVASGLEAAAIREASGTGFLIVTPGIRPQGSATPGPDADRHSGEAIAAGADYLVVGRPDHRGAGPAGSCGGDRQRDRLSALRLARQRAPRPGATKHPHRHSPRPASAATCRHGRR